MTPPFHRKVRRTPLQPEEIFPVWLVKVFGDGVRQLRAWLLFKTSRRRSVERHYLESSELPDVLRRRNAAIVAVARFLRETRTAQVRSAAASQQPSDEWSDRLPGAGEELPAAQEWLRGLAHPAVAYMVTAQAYSLDRRHAEAAECMGRALDVLLAPDLDPPPAVWTEEVRKRPETPRERQFRRDMAALARMFVAGEKFAAGRKVVALQEAELACDEQPSIAYLHEAHAELLYAAGRADAVLDALDRAAALRGVAQTREGRVNGAVLAAAATFYNSDASAEAPSPSNGVIRPGRAVLGLRELLDDGTTPPADKALVRHWLGLLSIEWSSRPTGVGAAGAPSHSEAARLLTEVARDEAAAPEVRRNASAWLPVAEGSPWRALHDGLREPGSRSEIVQTALRKRAGIAARPTRHRMVVAIPDSLAPAASLELLLDGPPEDDDANPTVEGMRRLVRTRYGIGGPTVLLQPLTNAIPNRVEISLDGVPLAASDVGSGDAWFLLPPGAEASPTRALDWFGRPLLGSRSKAGTEAAQPDGGTPVPAAARAIIFAAQALVRHLDRLLDARHASDLGLAALPYASWSPTLRLLLADRVPLTQADALHATIASVACGAATPLQAAERYRSFPSVRSALWGVEPDRKELGLPSDGAARLAACVPIDAGASAMGIGEGDARDLEAWAGKGVASSSHVRVVVDDAVLRPWLRTLLRPRFPDLPVMARHEVAPA